jgi:hypothetical protein
MAFNTNKNPYQAMSKTNIPKNEEMIGLVPSQEHHLKKKVALDFALIGVLKNSFFFVFVFKAP